MVDPVGFAGSFVPGAYFKKESCVPAAANKA
jgi:hypothetical protein